MNQIRTTPVADCRTGACGYIAVDDHIGKHPGIFARSRAVAIAEGRAHLKALQALGVEGLNPHTVTAARVVCPECR